MKNPLAAKAFGVHLRRIRESRELSQQELADLCDLSRRTIIRIENGDSTNLDVLVSLAKGLEIDFSELVIFEIPKEKGRK